MGVDLGLVNTATTSTGRFFSGRELFHDRQRFEEWRGKLQAKGTRSAHLTIKKVGKREKRYACNTLHVISKEIVKEAEEIGIRVVQVDPRYTSQKCSKCGHTERSNRNSKIRRFKCKKCGYEVHDDYNAAKNIANKYILAGQKTPKAKSYRQLALKSSKIRFAKFAEPAT